MELCEAQMIQAFTFESSVSPVPLFYSCFPSADAPKPFSDPDILLWTPQSSPGLCCFYDGRQPLKVRHYSACSLRLFWEAFDSVLCCLCS